VRPTVRFLSAELIKQIVDEARELLCTLGVEIHNPGVLELLHGHGARIDAATQRAYFTPDIIDRSLKSAPHGFKLYDSLGTEAVDLSGDNTNFTPGSAAITVLDHGAERARRPTASDYVRYAKLMCQLPHIASQSTAFVPQDVPEKIQDSYRLYLSLSYCEKPVVTGCFTIEAFELMKDLQLAVRGSAEALAQKPLTIFSCCPTAPIKWSDVTSQNVVDCARFGIPVEYISMPLSGFMGPVTMVGSLIQHTAETLSGVAISQLTRPGTPVLYGGSPAVFDIRYETTPMGDIGTMMIDCAYNEIGKSLGLPTQAYIGLSDAKLLDAQAGFETATGAMLAALSGINNCSGPGMLDFESCFSLEKLVLDNEICGSAKHMLKGITPKEDFPSRGHFEEMLSEGHLLISKHTRRYIKQEHYVPGPTIDRANKSRWAEEGCRTLGARAHAEVERLVAKHQPVRLADAAKQELTRLMAAVAHKHGLERLPVSV